MNKELPMELDDSRFELENRVKNLLWTVSGDYGLDMKPDVSLFLRSEAIALYDASNRGFCQILRQGHDGNVPGKKSISSGG